MCLGRLGDKAGTRAIVKALGEDDAFLRESAAVALSEGVREDDVDQVLPLLDAFERVGEIAGPVLGDGGAPARGGVANLTTPARCFAFGAKTPGYRVRFSRGGGTRGASLRSSSTPRAAGP